MGLQTGDGLIYLPAYMKTRAANLVSSASAKSIALGLIVAAAADLALASMASKPVRVTDVRGPVAPAGEVVASAQLPASNLR
jgi:hypothetical protein